MVVLVPSHVVVCPHDWSFRYAVSNVKIKELHLPLNIKGVLELSVLDSETFKILQIPLIACQLSLNFSYLLIADFTNKMSLCSNTVILPF